MINKTNVSFYFQEFVLESLQEAYDPQTAVAAAGVVPAAQPKSVSADAARSRAQVILVVIGCSRAFFACLIEYFIPSFI